jgi:hypothetical protein
MVTLMLSRCKQAVTQTASTASLLSLPGRTFAACFLIRRYRQSRAMLLLLLLTGTVGAAAQPETLEHQVKAAFLYQFPAYVEWPASSFADSTSPLIFGMLEADAIADELIAISRDNLVSGRTIVVRKMRPGDSMEGLNVLYVGQSQTRTSEPLLLQALMEAVLTITEAPAQRPDGSVINFAIIDDRVRFDVSLAMADQAGLTISSRLLQVARRVIEPNP